MFVSVFSACLCMHLCVCLCTFCLSLFASVTLFVSVLSASVYTCCMGMSPYLRVRTCTFGLSVSPFMFFCVVSVSLRIFVLSTVYDYSRTLPPFSATNCLDVHVVVAWVMLTQTQKRHFKRERPTLKNVKKSYTILLPC